MREENRHHHLYAIVALVLIAPLLFIEFPPFVDYYSHISRIFILNHLDAFSTFYSKSATVPPNIAMDVIVGFLSSFMPWQTAGWLFLVTIFGLQLSGLFVLSRRLWGDQKLYAGPLLASALLFNNVLAIGFLNYLFTLGLLFWALVVWLGIRERGWISVPLVGTAIAAILFYGHAVVFAIYAIIVLSHEIRISWPHSRGGTWLFFGQLTKSTLPLLLPLAIALSMQIHEEDLVVSWRSPYLFFRLKSIAWLFDSGWWPFEPAVLAFNILGILGLGALAIYKGRLSFSKSMLAPVVTLTVVFFLMPSRVATGLHLDDRLPLAIALLALASLRIDFKARSHGRLFGVLLVAFLTARGVYIAWDYMDFDKRMQAVMTGLTVVAPGSIVAVMDDQTSPSYSRTPRGYRFRHAASLATTQNPAFVATIHAIPHQQRIVVRPQFEGLYNMQENVPWLVSSLAEVKSILERIRSILCARAKGPAQRWKSLYVVVLHPWETANKMGHLGSVKSRTDDLIVVDMGPRETFCRGGQDLALPVDRGTR